MARALAQSVGQPGEHADEQAGASGDDVARAGAGILGGLDDGIGDPLGGDPLGHLGGQVPVAARRHLRVGGGNIAGRLPVGG